MKRGKTVLFRFLATMVMVSAFLPIIFNNLPQVVRSHHLWTILWAFATIMLNPRIFSNRIFQLVLLNGVVLFCIANDVIWVNLPEEANKMIYYEYYEITIGITLLLYFRMHNDYVGLAKITKITLYCILITAVLSILISLFNPMFARDIIGVDNSTESQRQEVLSFRKFGGGGYGFYSMLVSLFPLLIYYYRNAGESIWTRRTLFICGAIFYICLIQVQIFANLIVASLVIVLSFLAGRNFGRSMFIMLLFVIVIFLVPTGYYIELISWVSGFFDANSHIRFKLDDMAVFLSNGGEISVNTEAGIRAERFPLLWESFVSEPITGGKYYNHHLFWMNKLSIFGLLGTVPFVLLFYSFFKMNLRFCPEKFKLFMLISIFSIIFLGIIKALFGRELWYAYFLLLPGTMYLPLLKTASNPIAKTLSREDTSHK